MQKSSSERRSCCDRQLWLLTFALSGPEVTLDQLRTVGGFRMDECYIAGGVCHRFVLLVFSGETYYGLAVMERFLSRLFKECGVRADAWPGYGSAVSNLSGFVGDGGRIWNHPGFRLMIDLQRRMDPRLKTWALGINTHGLFQRFGPCAPAIERRWMAGLSDALKTVWKALRAIRVRHASAIVVVKVECRPEHTFAGVGWRRQREEVSVPYRYVKRANDDRWTLGWA
jgi:hypothetical protein